MFMCHIMAQHVLQVQPSVRVSSILLHLSKGAYQCPKLSVERSLQQWESPC